MGLPVSPQAARLGRSREIMNMRFWKLFLLFLAALFIPAQGLAGDVEVCNPAGVRVDGKYVDEFLTNGLTRQGDVWPPKVNDFPRDFTQKIAVEDDFADINRLFYLRGWTDGLPIVPPTPERVQKMLEGSDLPGDYLVGILKPLDGQATLEKIAANAVMAGCRPEHMPFLVAAVTALVNPGFDQLGVSTTTGYETHMMIVSGEAATQIDLNPGSGTLGRGTHGNSALGRAFHLVVQNIGGSAVGSTDMSTHGNPGEFGMCIVENQKASPWDSFKRDQGFSARANVVTIAAVGSANQLVSIGMTPEQMLDAIARIIASGGSKSRVIVWLMPPDVAAELAKAGFDKPKTAAAVAERLHGESPQLDIIVSGGPGEKNLLLSGFYAMKNLVSQEVELPSMWKTLIQESQADWK